MLIALIALDKTGALEVRKANRDAHIAYLKDTGVVQQAGPFLSNTGEMNGSLIVLDVPDMEAAQAWAAGDPYGKAGLFDSVTLRKWNKVI
jgi:uncharacterized protein YciI